jgi:H+-transporting ATPase
MYLKLSVAGHLTIFLTRTRGPFWSIRPAKILWIAVLGTQAIATLIAVYGFFMAPLGWRFAGIVWGYALLWFLLNDRIKLLTYWILDRSKSQAKGNVKALDRKADSKEATEAAKTKGIAATANVEATLDANVAQASDVKTETKSEKTAPAPAAEVQAKPDAKAAPAPEAKPVVKPDVKALPPEAKTEAKPDAKSASAPEVKAEANAAPATEAKSKAQTDLTPKLIERVHALYEELGRQDVLAVQELEKAEKTSKEETVP